MKFDCTAIIVPNRGVDELDEAGLDRRDNGDCLKLRKGVDDTKRE